MRSCLDRVALPARKGDRLLFQAAVGPRVRNFNEFGQNAGGKVACPLFWLDLLQPVYDWFTEGFDTCDLIEAKALLEALA